MSLEEFELRNGEITVMTEAVDDATWRSTPEEGDTVWLRPAGQGHDILVRVEAVDGGVFTGRVVSFTDGTPGLLSPMGYSIGQPVGFTHRQIQNIEIGCAYPG
ncbi:hypothetical protein HNP46_000531 [Pseudomonas nitritireducens]|uniref:Uncharacterized protein n=1 Tax=Pseudomonas nitroreducens TaxID=46680 RepID=A0A7W7KFU7_PSENT|nr:hypothetical protein [Pseudomonas nitritireducens]MBB4861720.1 hypothetical protein [Pseudomonas nitritireducens]